MYKIAALFKKYETNTNNIPIDESIKIGDSIE